MTRRFNGSSECFEVAQARAEQRAIAQRPGVAPCCDRRNPLAGPVGEDEEDQSEYLTGHEAASAVLRRSAALPGGPASLASAEMLPPSVGSPATPLPLARPPDVPLPPAPGGLPPHIRRPPAFDRPPEMGLGVKPPIPLPPAWVPQIKAPPGPLTPPGLGLGYPFEPVPPAPVDFPPYIRGPKGPLTPPGLGLRDVFEPPPCPPGYLWDPALAACWEIGQPKPPVVPGGRPTPECPEGKVYLGPIGICWRTGDLAPVGPPKLKAPKATIDDLVDEGAEWGGPGLGIEMQLAPPDATPLPFFSDDYDVSSQTLTQLFNGKWPAPEKTFRLSPHHWPVPSVFYECHSQGMAVGAGRYIMSCQQQRIRGGGENRGWLLIYDENDDNWYVKFPDPAHPHPAVGQGVFGKTVTDQLGHQYSPEIRMLVPIANTYTEGGTLECPGVPAMDLLDQDGEYVSRFCHGAYPGATGKDRRDLACAALFAHREKLYCFAIREDYLYVYRIHWHGPARRSAQIEVRQLVVQNMQADNLREAGGAGNSTWPGGYNSLNLFANKQGQIFMMCGKQIPFFEGYSQDECHLDLWRVEGGWSGGSGDPWSWDRTPTFHKVASGGLRKAPRPAPGITKKGLFHEGVAIAKHDDYHMGIYLLPYNFKHRICSGWPKKGHMCTEVYYYNAPF